MGNETTVGELARAIFYFGSMIGTVVLALWLLGFFP